MSYEKKNIKKKNKVKKIKSKKVEMTIEEAVGDTSGFQDKEFTQSRKNTVIYGLIGIALLIVFVILFLTTPKKVTFSYQDLQTKSIRFVLNKEGFLEDGPHDDDTTKMYYDFAGWYLNKACTIPEDGLHLTKGDESLLEYDFGKFKDATLYAKWEPTEYKIEYNVQGNIENLSTTKIGELKKINKNLNPSNYMVKHELSDYEKNEYIEYIKTTDIEKYINSKRSYQNIMEALELYNNNSKLDYLTLQPLSLKDINMSGYTFDHWENEETNEIVTQINKIDPTNLKLKAIWTKNK